MRNVLKAFLYFIIILALLGCLGYIVYNSYLRQVERNDKAQEIIEQEKKAKEIVSDEDDISEEEKTTPTPKESKKDTEVTPTEGAPEKEAATPTPRAGTAATPIPEATVMPTPEGNVELTATPTPEEAAAASSGEALAEQRQSTGEENNKDIHILILNGTKIQGVAGYWKAQLESDGYTAVTPASYNLDIEDQTVIYVKDSAVGEELKKQFPDATIKVGTVTDGIEELEDFPVPDNCEAYIVIGRQDAKNS